MTTRLRTLLLCLVVVATVTGPIRAETPAATTTAPTTERFAPYDYLTGGTWTVVEDVPGALAGVVTEYSFEFVLDRKFIQGRHSATREGKTLSSSISYLGWDAARSCMAQWGFNNAGMTAVLHAAPDATTAAFTLEGTIGTGERAPRIRTTYRRQADNEIEVTTEMLRQGQFVPVGTVRLKRP